MNSVVRILYPTWPEQTQLGPESRGFTAQVEVGLGMFKFHMGQIGLDLAMCDLGQANT